MYHSVLDDPSNHNAHALASWSHRAVDQTARVMANM
jgi:hypothetical protein